MVQTMNLAINDSWTLLNLQLSTNYSADFMMEETRCLANGTVLLSAEEVCAYGSLLNNVKSITAWTKLVILTLGVVCNLTAFLVLYKEPTLRTPSNYLVLSLTTADLIYCVNYIAAILLWRKLELSTPCIIVILINMHTTCASAWSLFAISLDRFMSVKSPLRHAMFMTPKLSYAMISGIWIGSGFIVSVLFLPVPEHQILYSMCQSHILNISRLTLVLYMVLATITPILLTNILYFFIIRIASQKNKDNEKRQHLLSCTCYHSNHLMYSKEEIHQLASFHRSTANSLISIESVTSSMHTSTECIHRANGHVHKSCVSKHRRRIARSSKILLIMSLSFLLSWLPTMTMNVLFAICEACRKSGLFYICFSLMKIFFVLTKVTNPCIYTIRNRDFKYAVSKLVKFRRFNNPEYV